MLEYLSARAQARTRRPESTAHVLHISEAPTPLDNVLHDGYRFIFQFSATLITAGIFESS